MDKVPQGKEGLCVRKGNQPIVKDNDVTPEAPFIKVCPVGALAFKNKRLASQRTSE
jgi:hypothetical protein